VAKTKGSAVLAAVKLLRSRRPEALALLRPQLHKYLDERIIVAAWYPEEDLLGLITACAGVFPVRGDSIFETMGALAARGHLEGVYADLVQRSVAARAATLWKSQHDTGQLVLVRETENSATYELVDWGLSSGAYCRLLGGYFAEVHRFAGASEPSFAHPSCRAGGQERCVWEIRWS
jgi:hypothetical protein